MGGTSLEGGALDADGPGVDHVDIVLERDADDIVLGEVGRDG
jgi:hypothetical protein